MPYSLRKSASTDSFARSAPVLRPPPPPSRMVSPSNQAGGQLPALRSPSYERIVPSPSSASTATPRGPTSSLTSRSQSSSVSASPLPPIPLSPTRTLMSIPRPAAPRTSNPSQPPKRITPTSTLPSAPTNNYNSRTRAPATSFDSKSRPPVSPPPPTTPQTFFESGNKSSTIRSLQTTSVSLAVLGTPTCGKSSIIDRGLFDFGLSDPTTFSISRPNGTLFRYTKRAGQIEADDHHPCSDLTVYEVDVPFLPPNAPASRPKDKMLNFWPSQAPCIDAVLICYDVTNRRSFGPIEDVLAALRPLNLPTICLACKSDAQVKQIDPSHASRAIIDFDIGLVEVSAIAWSQRDKIKRSFDWILKAIFRERRRVGLANANNSHPSSTGVYKNPASPEVLNEAHTSWDPLAQPSSSRAATPTAKVPFLDGSSSTPLPVMLDSPPVPPPKELPPFPPHVHPFGSLFPDTSAESQQEDDHWHHALTAPLTTAEEDPPTGEPQKTNGPENMTDGAGEGRDQQQGRRKTSSFQWTTLGELLDKLMFLAVSGDDPNFISHFLLTYRRFTTPRTLLLAMQKRMRQLDNPSGDPMFACFAQMRICNLLEQWIQSYPHDFAVRGTAGALTALVKAIIGKTYLLHYGAEFLPFLEQLPTLVDTDAAWAYKDDDGDDESSIDSGEEDDVETEEQSLLTTTTLVNEPEESNSTIVGETPRASIDLPANSVNRMRKPSLPLGSKSFLPSPQPPLGSGSNASALLGGPVSSPNNNPEITSKQLLRELLKVAHDVNQLDSNEIAEEITRLGAQLFLEIKPRAWLHFTFVPGKKDPQTDKIARFNTISNHLADWVVSLILCHDKPKMRAKQIDKFVEIALRLRTLNNYSALRAFVAGINNATFPGDQTMEQFKARFPEQAKNLQSWEVLLQAVRSHRSYRMALRNSKGPCIPAQEVHMSDLIRTHEGNPETAESHPDKIHWGKFHLIGKLVCATNEIQAQHESTKEYAFTPRPHVRSLLLREFLMNEDMQKSRLSQQDEPEDWRQPPAPGKEVALLRRIFF